jgi:hypothetical protein
MASLIDNTKPVAGTPTTQSVRDNFTAAKNEILALQRQIGYADYNDTLTATTPISVGVSTWTKLTNNTLGANTRIALPTGITSVWNSTTNQLDLSQLPIDSTVEWRADLEITTTSVNQVVRFRTSFAIGNASPFFINDGVMQYKTAALQAMALNGSFYVGSTSVKNFPAEFQLFSDAACTVKVLGWFIRVTKFLG